MEVRQVPASTAAAAAVVEQTWEPGVPVPRDSTVEQKPRTQVRISALAVAVDPLPDRPLVLVVLAQPISVLPTQAVAALVSWSELAALAVAVVEAREVTLPGRRERLIRAAAVVEWEAIIRRAEVMLEQEDLVSW